MKPLSSRINDVLFTIHRDLCGDLSARSLADVAACTETHLHRLFRAETGHSLHSYVRSARLEQAANQLMFDPSQPVAVIAEKCGYDSLSSFTKAFKANFGMTPGQWRRSDQHQDAHYLNDPVIAKGYENIADKPLPPFELLELPPLQVAYIRHKGYGLSIRQPWQLLQAWAATEKRDFTRQIGLHHSNPAWVPLNNCRYVACIEIDKPVLRRGTVNAMIIPGGLHACFRFSGVYGELLPWISKVQDQWLPESGLKMQTTPAYVRYLKNHFLSPDQSFDLIYCLPVSFY